MTRVSVYVVRSEVGTIFSLSWLITWYGHVLPHLRDIVRCYDFFIACHPLMPIYLAAAVSYLMFHLCVYDFIWYLEVTGNCDFICNLFLK